MENWISSGKKLGILGGGQLGKMLIQASSRWDIHVAVLDPTIDCPASHLANSFTHGHFNDYQAVLDFGKDLDVLTIEIENVNTEALRELRNEGKEVYPAPEIIETIKDKGLQKEFYRDHGIASSPFERFGNAADIKMAIESGELQVPFVQKACREGYDGRGVAVVRSTEDINKLLDAESIVEPLVNIDKEISVILSRNKQGEINAFPLVEMEFSQEANLVEMLIAPARVPEDIAKKATDLGMKVVRELDLIGLIAVEMFLTPEGEILVNESAPRPHNSGHHTIEANLSSQYEQHLRSILGMPLGDCHHHSSAVMINVLGAKGHHGQVTYRGTEAVWDTPGAYLHIYGKKQTKPFRKMGHITICSNELEDAIDKGRKLKNAIQVEAIS